MEPKQLSEIDIPNELKSFEGSPFLMADKEIGQNNRVILLGTKEHITELSNSDLWMMDGTFKIVPKVMCQLFTIFCKVGSDDDFVMVPACYILMSSKTKKCYEEAFKILKTSEEKLGIEFNPKYILFDFEKASISAAKTHFPEATFKGKLLK